MKKSWKNGIMLGINIMKTLEKFIEVDGVKYYPVIGLEIHAEMKTNTKMWCACKNEPDVDEPNVNICPVCMAHPGTLPVPNKQAIQNVIKMGIACGSTIANYTEFDRKNYFYPDIPKGYQISQYKYPLVSGGSVAGVELTRIHLEEDTATSQHDKDDATLINFNRAGVPLMELVTEPVIHDSETAVAFAKEVQLMLKYLDISNADIEKGHMRLEANVSITTDPNKFGTKVEVKNIGSFKSLERAIEFEFKRHIKCLQTGERIVQETRGFDEASGTTKSQRSKENAEDYRYFPDPDISKLMVAEDEFLKSEFVSKSIPELPNQRRARYEKLGLKKESGELFVTQPIWGNYFDAVGAPPFLTIAANYIGSDLVGLLKNFTENEETLKSKLPNPEYIKELCQMIAEEKLASRGAKDLLAILVKNKEAGIEESAVKIATDKNLLQISDATTLTPMVETIIADEKNAKSIADYKAGKEQALMALVGQVIRNTSGRANPTVTKNIFVEKLK
jgi:aspartyl-tRNA(Asn)/glutamyl-tRNA(Gln) amidotransferase subunit B